MLDTQYRLSISPTLEAFRPEIEHVCRFLDAAYNISRSDAATRVLHYGGDAPVGSIAIPSHLFPTAVQTGKDGIHPRREALVKAVIAGRLLPSDGARAVADRMFRYDPIGLIFFSLSRLEERGYPDLDRYNRFPVGGALIGPERGRLYPWADHAARDLAAAIIGQAEPPPRTRYQVKFTHDIDTLKGYHRALEPARSAIGDILKRSNPQAAWKRIRHSYFGGEPFSSIRRLVNLSERCGIKSNFYFMGPSTDLMDSTYAMRWPQLTRRIADEIRARGHELGFHPGFRTFDNPAEWMRQRDGIEAIIGATLRQGRHHVLRYDSAITPRIWSDAGMELDCTLSYPEVAGFRSGTCRPHHAYDLVARETLPLKQQSTAVMEFGFFGGKYFDHSVEQALADSLWAVDMCRKFGGTFTILHHPGQLEQNAWRWIEALIPMAV
jgi:hypothetical protein